ncbi:Uncharacterised protein [Mycobacterium tuberculosis]|nr:Uncharacterised protein [Mycobacterium tuberculosis]
MSTTASTGALAIAEPSSPGSSRMRSIPALSSASPSVRPSIIAVVTGSRKAARRCPSRTTATIPLRPRRSEAARGSGPV